MANVPIAGLRKMNMIVGLNLKIMLTNYCIYDCAYCVNRRSNDLPRATFSVS